MSSEDETPVRERYLTADGLVSGDALARLGPSLPPATSEREVIVFFQFAYADIPLGKEYERVFAREDVNRSVRCRSRIVAATQQWARPIQYIPHGWKTIGLVEFPDGVPQLVRELPFVETWYVSRFQICLSSEETWELARDEQLQRIGQRCEL